MGESTRHPQPWEHRLTPESDVARLPGLGVPTSPVLFCLDSGVLPEWNSGAWQPRPGGGPRPAAANPHPPRLAGPRPTWGTEDPESDVPAYQDPHFAAGHTRTPEPAIGGTSCGKLDDPARGGLSAAGGGPGPALARPRPGGAAPSSRRPASSPRPDPALPAQCAGARAASGPLGIPTRGRQHRFSSPESSLG